MEKNWYVLFVSTKNEDKIKAKLISEGFEAFVPKTKLLYRKEGLSKLVTKPLFPGYIFVESELDYADFNYAIGNIRNQTLSFLKLLKVDNIGTSVLYPEEKAYIKQLLNNELIMEHSTGLIEGDKVIIIDGPLKGLESSIVKIDRHKRRAIIEVMIRSVPTQIKVSLEIISKV